MAIYAIHQQRPEFIFIINYKVMYSSLKKILSEYFPEIKFYHKNKVTEFKFSDYPKFAIVRNPYSRTVSTYYDKCQKTPEISINETNAQLQFCQHQLLQSLKVLRNKTYEIVEPAIFFEHDEIGNSRALLNDNLQLLKGISFEEYMECLALILDSEFVDGHFQKQHTAFSISSQNPFYFPSKVFINTQIFKMENIDNDWKTICEQLGKELILIKRNQTDNIRPDIDSYYDRRTRKLVNKLYKIDFKKYNYSFH